MDRTSKILCLLLLTGVITLGVGSTYIPQMGGTIPEGMRADEFIRQQQLDVYNSSGFKITMVGTGITVASLLSIIIRSCIDEYKQRTIRSEERPKETRSILKVKRSTIVPQEAIEIIVEDVKPETIIRPQIRTSPTLVPIPAPSSSPPIQLIPSKKVNFMELQPYEFKGPVIEKIKFNRNLNYPSPYERVRHG